MFMRKAMKLMLGDKADETKAPAVKPNQRGIEIMASVPNSESCSETVPLTEKESGPAEKWRL